MARRKSPRQKGPETAEELAAHIKRAGGVHLHHLVVGKKRKQHWWKLTLGETRRCFGPDCFVMRVKNVRETPTPPLTGGAV